MLTFSIKYIEFGFFQCKKGLTYGYDTFKKRFFKKE